MLKLKTEFGEASEVQLFVETFAPLLADAMRLGSRKIADETYQREASRLKKEIMACVEAPANHLGIRHIQEIFRDHEGRLFHWVDDRRVPCHNNYAERTVRGTVIARKVSFGSQSEQGAASRSTLMSVLHTARIRLGKRDALVKWLKNSLDRLAGDMGIDISQLLPSIAPHSGASPPPNI